MFLRLLSITLILAFIANVNARGPMKEVVGDCRATLREAAQDLKEFKNGGTCDMYDECECYINYCLNKHSIGRNFWCFLKVYV